MTSLDAKQTRIHQLKVFFITATLYSFLHASRTAWAYSKPTISKEFNLTNSQLGWFDFSFLIAYGVGLFLNGWLGDRLKVKSLLTQGMLVTVFALMAFSFEEGFMMISSMFLGMLFFLINGLGQSTGFPSILNMLTNWFPAEQRGFVFGAWMTNTSIGNIIGQQIGRLTIDTLGIEWPYAILSTAVCILILTGLLHKYIFASPADASPTSPKEVVVTIAQGENNESLGDLDNTMSQRATATTLTETPERSIGFWEAWKVPGVLLYAVAFMCIKASGSALMFWLPTYLKLDVGFKTETASLLAMYEIGNLVGLIALGYLADRKKALRSYMMMCSLICAVIIFVTLSFVKSKSAFSAYCVLLFLGGVFIGGPAGLISGAVSSDLGEDERSADGKTKVKKTSTIIGIVDGSGTVASAAIQPLIPIFKSHSFLLYSGLLLTAAIIVPFARKKASEKDCDYNVSYKQEDLEYHPEELGI